MGLHGKLHGLAKPLQALDPLAEQRVLAAQVDERVGAGVRERLPDLVQAEPQLPVEEDPLETLDVASVYRR